MFKEAIKNIITLAASMIMLLGLVMPAYGMFAAAGRAATKLTPKLGKAAEGATKKLFQVGAKEAQARVVGGRATKGRSGSARVGLGNKFQPFKNPKSFPRFPKGSDTNLFGGKVPKVVMQAGTSSRSGSSFAEAAERVQVNIGEVQIVGLPKQNHVRETVRKIEEGASKSSKNKKIRKKDTGKKPKDSGKVTQNRLTSVPKSVPSPQQTQAPKPAKAPKAPAVPVQAQPQVPKVTQAPAQEASRATSFSSATLPEYVKKPKTEQWQERFMRESGYEPKKGSRAIIIHPAQAAAGRSSNVQPGVPKGQNPLPTNTPQAKPAAKPAVRPQASTPYVRPVAQQPGYTSEPKMPSADNVRSGVPKTQKPLPKTPQANKPAAGAQTPPKSGVMPGAAPNAARTAAGATSSRFKTQNQPRQEWNSNFQGGQGATRGSSTAGSSYHAGPTENSKQNDANREEEFDKLFEQFVRDSRALLDDAQSGGQ